MALLVKTKFACAATDEIHEHICVVSELHGSEMTVCGMACDCTLEHEYFEWVDTPYRASLAKATCTSCMRKVKYFKGLR